MAPGISLVSGLDVLLKAAFFLGNEGKLRLDRGWGAHVAAAKRRGQQNVW